jgi:hypothetical protein
MCFPLTLRSPGASCRPRPGTLSLTKRLRCRLRQGGMNVRSAGLEPAVTWLSTRPVYPIAARAYEHEQSPRLASNQLPSAYEADALPDELQGQGNQPLPEQDSNLHLRDPESRVLPIRRPGIVATIDRPRQVRAERLELSRASAHQILRLARLPVTPRPRAPPGS